MGLEVVVVPVTDVDRAKAFYTRLGWRLDGDTSGDELRFVQITPPGSRCSIAFGSGITTAVPGTAQGLHLVVVDIEAARADLQERGAEVSEVFHDGGGVFHHGGHRERVPGLDPGRRSYASFASFADPDGNGWLLQEVASRPTAAALQHEAPQERWRTP
ncbi:VOC family protein [Actinomycetospora sp. NBRC 106375]|uniref:VOC family protein n=1 Tax=Actinomycetospora sp. NBRC 106375 TaxID=3032207 RepID=UPI00332BAFD5